MNRMERIRQLRNDIDSLETTITRVRALRGRFQAILQELQTANRSATIDGLTGLLRRDAFMSGLDVMAESFRRSGNSTSADVYLIMIDVDNFKKINDTFGHNTGDLVLKSVANAILTSLSPYDMHSV